MKRKIVLWLATIISAVALVIVVSACGSLFGAKGGDTVDVTWDPGITTGVTRITSDGLRKGWVRVSPDGTRLLYTEASRADNWQIVYLRDANNPAKTPMVGEVSYSPSWYEDSGRFVYVSYESGKGRLVRSSVSGGGKTYISNSVLGQSGDDTPSVRNGIIVFTARHETGYQIATIKENGTETTIIGDGRMPSWHPTEDKLVFIKPDPDPKYRYNVGGDIYEMDINSGQITQLYRDPDHFCYEPSYSPDGRRILFTKGTAVRTTGTITARNFLGLITKQKTVSDETTKRHVFVMNVDGTNVSVVSSGGANVISPSWGANGEVFCLVGMPNKQYEIYKLRLRGE
jgi:Tol biopolymer transport system component